VTDWRKLIGKRESVVMPYFGGSRVRSKDREVTVTERPDEPGWYRFEIEGRKAKPMEPAEATLAGLPKLRGLLAFESLFVAGTPPEYVRLMPEDEPPLFGSCTCHRWYSGELVFGEMDFEGEAEETARQAFAARTGLDDEKGVSATLRAAFAWATVRRASRERGIPCRPREVWAHASEVASGGHAAAEALLDRFDELRRGKRIVVAGQAIHIREMVTRATLPAATLDNAAERAETVLTAAGARLTQVRRIAHGAELEVHFEFGGERFVSLVRGLTLQVIDAGICLVDHFDGHRGDDELTLDSLPAAIREAMDLGVLVITRH
jgi:hypothetical protein